MDKKMKWEDKFEYISELGKGGNGSVYKVKRKSNTEIVALKYLYNKSIEKKARFIDEIDIMKNNYEKIEGIIPIIEYSKEEFWYTMPLAEPVLDHIRQSKEDILSIIENIIMLAQTLSELHSIKISHRDIKPSNIYYYKNRYYFGDFGLVEIPNDEKEFTKSDRGLGAVFTIAPEMKRNPKKADGKKADVFSLAKTIWMLLTDKECGFDGVYNFSDKSHSLRFMEKIKDVHLVELETLLKKATENNPDNRPNIISFIEEIKEWVVVMKDFEKSQNSEWDFIKSYLFGENPPDSTVWRSLDSIINVLSIVGGMKAYNHMLLADGGGLDFTSVEKASEKDCIYLYDSWKSCFVIKPKCLYYEGFGEKYTWNYFLLEFDELLPILDGNSRSFEFLVEDYPGSYISDEYSQYGVYDYDTGKKLPKNYKNVRRYLNGKILIVLKNGQYNKIGATYDGRHNMFRAKEFRDYINNMINIIDYFKDRGYSEEIILNNNKIFKNPFEKSEAKFERRKVYQNSKSFIRENYKEWNFKELFNTKEINGKCKFYITFSVERTGFFIDKLYLCDEGKIKEKKEGIYYIYDKKEAIALCDKCNQKFKIICKNAEFDLADYENYFRINMEKCAQPEHLFTKEEIRIEMLKADDRKNNMLIIDGNGVAKVVEDVDYGYLYPVRHEIWNAGNKYVGKYSDILTLDDDYLSSLQGWLKYLESGKSQYVDFVQSEDNIDELIKKIKKKSEL